jgi:hypothetical protein
MDSKEVIILHTNVFIFLIGFIAFLSITLYFQLNVFQDTGILLLLSMIFFGLTFVIHSIRLGIYYQKRCCPSGLAIRQSLHSYLVHPPKYPIQGSSV